MVFCVVVIIIIIITYQQKKKKKKNHHHHYHYLSFSVFLNERLSLQWVEEPTLLVTRFEYANLFHTITDWYSAYVSSRVTGLPNRPNVVFVDGHCMVCRLFILFIGDWFHACCLSACDNINMITWFYCCHFVTC